MNYPNLKRATYSAFLTSLVFWLLFQLSKIGVIQNASPFAEDPYDAVASFAFQIAMAIALLSLARLVSIQEEDGLRQRAPFILHGILLVEFCVLITLTANLTALVNALPLNLTASMIYIISGMALLTGLFLLTGILWLNARREIGSVPAQPNQHALGQTIRDCWTLITVFAAMIVRHLPVLLPLWNSIDSQARKTARTWNEHLPFADPNEHPWGFAMTFAVLIGLLVMGFIMIGEGVFEGGPKSLAVAFLVAGIFFAGETTAVFLSFLLFGGYLGLRPKL